MKAEEEQGFYNLQLSIHWLLTIHQFQYPPSILWCATRDKPATSLLVFLSEIDTLGGWTRLASYRFSHIHVIIMTCWILRTLSCPLSEGLQAYNTPECYRTCNTHAHKSLWYTDQLNLSTSPVAYHHPLTFIYNLITHHPHFTHLHYHIHYRLFEWSFNVAGQHSKEPLPMSQNHIIRAWMSCTEGWVLTATNAYSELAPDSWILCGAG